MSSSTHVPTPVVPTRAVDALVADDAASTIYAPLSEQADLSLPPAIRSKRDYLFRELVVNSGIPPWSLHVDDVALYSVTESRVASEMTGALSDALTATFGGGASGAAAAARAHVIDACACVGGNALSFAQRFARVEAYELSPQRARLLAHNGSALRLAVTLGVGFTASGDVVGAAGGAGGAAPPQILPVGRGLTVHCADFSSLVSATTGRSGLVADAVFFDPPWGGPSYGDSALIDMSLGASDVCDLTASLLARPLRARVIALKAPLNFNTARLTKTLSQQAPGSRIVRTITKKNMQLLIIAAAQELIDTENKRAEAVAEVEGGGARREGAAAGVKRPRTDDDATSLAAAKKWVPSGREAEAPPAGAIAMAMEAIDDEGRRTGLFLRAAPTGAVILSRDPEILFVSGGGTVALRTVFHGILRGSRSTLRAMCRSERHPAPVGPDDTEKWLAVLVPGRGGVVALKLPALSAFLGGRALANGTEMELVRIPVVAAAASKPLFFRPVFRDALGPILSERGGDSRSCAPAEAALFSAFGVHVGGRFEQLPRCFEGAEGAGVEARAGARAASLERVGPTAIMVSDRDDDFLFFDILPAPHTEETRALLASSTARCD